MPCDQGFLLEDVSLGGLVESPEGADVFCGVRKVEVAV
jgi:hypothetical protein